MGRLLDAMRRARAERTYDVPTCDQSDLSDESPHPCDGQAIFGRLSRFCRNSIASESRSPRHSTNLPDGLHHVLDVLDSRCPDHIEHDRWRQAIEDGGRFLANWGAQAAALGWTARDLFGLHAPPDGPHQRYRRLSRYDETGLIWLLNGREVTALTTNSAAIRSSGGSITVYRKNSKPADGPAGNSLDDFTP
jgi:hypothetical protein